MSEINSYEGIAKRNLNTAENLLSTGDWNDAVRYCQQYIEKIFKSCIEANGSTNDDKILLTSHNIVSLADRVSSLLGISFPKEARPVFFQLRSLYFDTNYPGNDYMDVSENEARELYEWTRRFQIEWEKIILMKIE